MSDVDRAALADTLAESTTLSETRQRAVEQGLAQFHETAQRAAQLETERQELLLQVKQQELEIASLHERLDQASTMLVESRADRDRAVGDRAYVEAVLSVVRRAMDEAEMPPPVRQVAPLETAQPEAAKPGARDGDVSWVHHRDGD